MPHADMVMAKLTGCKTIQLDFIRGLWQFPLAKDSQDCQSFRTPFGAFSPYRVLHCATNSVSFFLSTMEAFVSHLNLLIRLEDMLGYAEDADNLIETLMSVFEICTEQGLKPNPRMCDFMAAKVQLCCRMIGAEGVNFHPRQHEALKAMEALTNVGVVMELVHGANWMRTAIPRFSELVEPLHSHFEAQCLLHSSSKKSRVCNRPLPAYEDEDQAAFTSLVQAITPRVTLATANPGKRLRIFADASSTHFAGMLTQVDPGEIATSALLLHQWNHHPGAFVHGSSRGASSRWTSPEKESYTIFASATRLSPTLAACFEFSLFTDSKNILYTLSLTRFKAKVAHHIVRKMQRWALRLSEFNVTVEHIPRDLRSWAECLTRWPAPRNSEIPARRISAFRVPFITEDLPELP